VGNKKVLHGVKKGVNIVHTINRSEVKCIFQFLDRNIFLKHVIEGKIEGRIEVMGRRRRRHEQLLAGLKEKRGCCKLKEEVLDLILWRNCFVRGYRPVVRQTTGRMRINCTNNCALLGYYAVSSGNSLPIGPCRSFETGSRGCP
jgi:hypothetical protein